MVHELLTQQGQSFFQANENKPENIAGNTARLFLGVKLECGLSATMIVPAPTARATGRESSSGSTRLSSTASPASSRVDAPGSGASFPPKIKIPDKNVEVEAKFLDGQKPEWKTGDNPVSVLADWLTTAENPYFARAAVNRLWDYFFGTGLIDPVDVMGSDDNPPSHPELLDELARQFAAHNFDLKYLIRAITATRAYQLTSAPSDDEPGRPASVRPDGGARPERRAALRQRADGDRLPETRRRRQGQVFFGQPNTPRPSSWRSSPTTRTSAPRRKRRSCRRCT